MAFSRAFAESLAVVTRESDELGANDLRRWLADALSDCCEPGQWCYLEDFIGDSVSGDAIYCCNGDMKKAGYQITSVNGKMTAQIDAANAVDVLPRTVYEEEADEADHYASMESARLYTKGDVPLCERNVSKKERDAADESSFAGKGKSFPILKAGDVMAAVRSMGRAGSDNHDAATLKENIIRIAKKKGFGGSLPKAWQKGDAKESARVTEAGKRHSATDQKLIQTIHDHSIALGAASPSAAAKADESAAPAQSDLRLVESGEFCGDIPLAEAVARTNYPIRVITPGTGTSAHYPAEMLKREAAKFKPGTLMFWNHPTRTEESERPEGNLDNLAAILTSQGRYEEGGSKGPGIYADAKVMADYAQKVAERAPHIGLSIRAGGVREGDKSVDGKPVLKEFSYIESVDYVTKAGRGGLALAEAARDAGVLSESAASAQSQQQESTMTAAEQAQFTALQESTNALRAETRKIRERQALADAGGVIAEYYRSVRVSEGVQQRVTSRLLAGTVPLTEAGDLDSAKLKTIVEAETKDECEYIGRISGGRIVTGMGATAAAGGSPPDPAKVKEAEAARVKELDRSASLYGFGGKDHEVGRRILNEGRSAFDPFFNAREHGAIMQAGAGSLPGLEA